MTKEEVQAIYPEFEVLEYIGTRLAKTKPIDHPYPNDQEFWKASTRTDLVYPAGSLIIIGVHDGKPINSYGLWDDKFPDQLVKLTHV